MKPIQVYTNNIVFTLRNKGLFIQNYLLFLFLLMLFIYLCKVIFRFSFFFFRFFVFLIYNYVYFEHTQRWKKRWQQKSSKTIEKLLENYCKQIGFSEKTVIVQQSIRKTDLLLLATKLIKKFMILVMLKNIMNII